MSLAGESAETWNDVCETLNMCTLISFDLRGHGRSTLGCEELLSLDVLTSDLKLVIDTLLPLSTLSTAPRSPLFLIGHSLGASIAASLSSSISTPSSLSSNSPSVSFTAQYNLKGLILIDVSGTLDPLGITEMDAVVKKIPETFKSFDEAFKWSLKKRKNVSVESARSCLERRLLFEDEDGREGVVRWKTDLYKTRVYWSDWFLNLTSNFLSSKTSKCLILARTDRLDKLLMIAQMQGKFQMVVMNELGHYVQEEDPEGLGREIRGFVERNAVVVIKKFVL